MDDYINTLVLVADDTKVECGTVPKPKAGGGESVAGLEYRFLTSKPYTFTRLALIAAVKAEREGGNAARRKEILAELSQKGQPCMRASPLCKTYGWGAHHDDKGRIALVGMETPEYQALSQTAATVKAMRSSRK